MSPSSSSDWIPDSPIRGKHGLLIADLDLDAATGLLASRCKLEEYGPR
jgi:hypothetical protein